MIDFERIDQYCKAEDIKRGTVTHVGESDTFIYTIDNYKAVAVSIIRSDVVVAEKWSYRYVSQLPDMAFAIVYQKNNRKIRKLPHHKKTVKSPDENSSVDIPHLRNALARLPQLKGDPPSVISKAKKHLDKHAKVLLKTKK